MYRIVKHVKLGKPFETNIILISVNCENAQIGGIM